MSISTPFIRRPVATTLFLVAITLAGAIAYTLLPVAALPEVDFPTIMVSAGLPGASPDVMAASVATPLEKQFTRIAGISEMTSRSSVGSASVVLQFDLGRDINGAAREVQAAINSATGFLPANLPSRPKYRKINPADQPILLMTLESDVVPRPQLYDIASSIFAQKLAQVEGVGQVNVGGSSLPAVRVEVNPQPLARYNVGLDQIGSFLQNANSNRPKGSLANGEREVPIYASDQLMKADDYKDLVVVYRKGAPVRLSDLGRVIDANEDVRNLGVVNGNPMVQIQISRQPGANIVETVDRIKALMPSFQAQLPPTVRFKIASDRTITTRDSLHDAQRNVIVSIGLVVLVVFMFLRSGWSTFIPSISVPVSIIATFGAMYLLGYTLDNLSLMALTIATGFVVDDAIVVIENIMRHIEDGMKPMQAAYKGAAEIGFTVLSMSISLIAVFIPILMMSGVVGRLFREFAVILAASITLSMVVSLTVIPMMCGHLLKVEHNHGWIYMQTEKFYRFIISSYGAALEVVLDHPASILVTVLLTLGMNVYLYNKVPKGFFPQQDTGRLQGAIMGQQHISYQALVSKAKWFEEKIHSDPDVEAVTMVAGSSGGFGGGGNSAQINVQLKPVGVRKATSDQVVARLRRQTSGVPGATMFLQNSQDVRVGGRQGNAQYQYTLQAPDFDSLALWGPKVMERLMTLPEIADVSSDQQNSGLSANVVIDRDTASRLGLTAQAVDSALYDSFGQRQVSVMYKSINQYHVVLALQQQWWASPDFLNTIYVQTPKGSNVPLSTFTHFTQGITPISLPHQGQFPATTLSFNLGENVALSDAVAAIKRAEQDMGLPTNITGKFAGTARAYQEALNNQPILILTALVAVYIVLGILYESLIHPLTIISTLPSAGVGALVAMVLFKSDLDIVGMIGIILLIGIVKKNAIMMIDFALAAERNEGMNARDAIYQACLLRFRPIMMTTACALLGGLPMALSWGAGAELRRPLGIAIVGGLVVSQMLTLFTTPVIYLYFDRLRKRFSRQPSYANRPAFLIPGGVA
ncbi:MAG TPA: efflux RND transporter permease subunit [Candidatus Sulfopaludibacter sp.]|jgi:multidrug efflux pump|nr:efflux RND transporter permease subunit [Candidatus Sulfopaludibacter sp.]